MKQLLVALALVAFSSPAHAQGAMLRLGLQDNPSTLDPALASNVPAITLSHQLFNNLVGYDEHARLHAELAASYTVSSDLRRYRFVLRPGVKFHDGHVLTSKDVRHTFERLIAPGTKSPGSSFYRMIVGAPALLAGQTTTLSGLQTPRPDTVTFELSEPTPTFLALLGLNFAAIVPATAGADFGHHPVGTGPFAFSRLESGQRLVFKRNASYFKPGKPKLAGLEVLLGVNEQVEALRFERGELDAIGVMRAIGAADFTRLAREPRWAKQFLSGPDNATYYIGMNTHMKPFDDVRVRRAVAMAIDKVRLVKLVNGRGVPATSFLPPTLPGHDATIQAPARDLARAKALLAAAGYPAGLDVTYWCSNSQTSLKTAQSIQQDLGQIGIRATLKPLAFPTFLAGVGRADNAPIFSGNWSQDYPDPANFLGTLFHSASIRGVNSLNTTFFRDAQVDRWLDEAARTPLEAKRFALYHKVEARVLDQAPVVPLYHPKRFILATERVHGLMLHPVWPLAAETVEVR